LQAWLQGFISEHWRQVYRVKGLLWVYSSEAGVDEDGVASSGSGEDEGESSLDTAGEGVSSYERSGGIVSGDRSPAAPPEVPLFTSHAHYVTWMHDQLALGSMLNVRHLWTSVRPNGDRRPESLNRLELRICDLISDPRLLLAVTAWAELRLLMLMGEPDRLDPLVASALSPEELATLADQNDRAAAQHGLNAMVCHWRTGEQCLARDWLAEELEAMAPLAENLNLGATLEPLNAVLALGSESMRWLDRHRAGEPIDRIIATEAMAMEARDSALWAELTTDHAHALG
jgi:predicted glutamate--cysteine ligase